MPPLAYLLQPDTLLFADGTLIAFAALNAVRPFRPTLSAGAGFFFLGWLTTELALQHVVLQAFLVTALVHEGALHAWTGLAGFALALAACAVLVHLHVAGQLALAATRGAFLDAGLTAEPLGPKSASLFEAIFPFASGRRGVRRSRGKLVHQGDGYTLCADVFHRTDKPPNAPVLVYVHGGGWIIGFKKYQGLPLLYLMAAAGWVCVSIDYRLSPTATFPDHLIDVKRGIAWAREHAAEFGGDPTFVGLCGNSAGAHLAALAALTSADKTLQPGFESSDTHVDACAGLYGVYDLTNRYGHWPSQGTDPLWEALVIKRKRADAPDLFRLASPVDQVHAGAPPFLLIHGTHDSLAPIEESRRFADALRKTSDAPVLLAEIEGAQHAFEIFHSVRGRYAVQAVAHFLVLMASRTRASLDGAARREPPAA